MNKFVCGIYKIACEENNSVYIGSSIDIKTRWGQHKIELKANRHTNEVLQFTYNRYGKGSLTYSILDRDLKDYELCEHEQWWLDAYRIDHVLMNLVEPIRSNYWTGMGDRTIVDSNFTYSIDGDEIAPFGWVDKHRPKWHAWVYGGGENPLNSVPRKRKSKA